MKIDDPRVKINLAELASALAGTGDPGLIGDFLHCLLTPAEIADIATRWALVKELKSKTPQREIARDLGISLCKITRGSRELKKPGSAFQRMLEAREREQEGKLRSSGSFEVPA
jgi:TrpR family trp operon transcriptional repressor